MPAIASPLPCRLAFRLALLLAAVHSASAQGLDFTLPDLDNRPVRLADFRGKWVVVNFWATWCPPCLLEMPELQVFHEAHGNRAAVIGINMEDLAPTAIRSFAARLAVTFPIVLSGGKPVSGFDLKGLPTTFLVSPAGKLADTHLGTVTAAMLAERLAELDKADAPPRY
ncbi:MAG: TlpA disulfide reductase family protein [Candidatus Competibacter sp.]|nr:TlpA disulfide reductase family protein [Candidatus Competibacter sp.]